MDEYNINRINQRKIQLESEIEKAIISFIKETGCPNNINIETNISIYNDMNLEISVLAGVETKVTIEI